MTKLHILGVPTLVLLMLAPNAMAQRRGGGAGGQWRRARSDGRRTRWGERRSETGAKVGAVAGATRAAVDREAERRAEYQTSADYQNAPRSDFNTAPPQVLATAPPAAATAPPAATARLRRQRPAERPLIRKDGKPVIGITYPSDWKQSTGDRYVSAVSADGQAYSMIATLEGAADKQAGIAKVKQGLEQYLQDIKYDDPRETKRGALVVPARERGRSPASTWCSRLGSSIPAQGNSPGRHSSSIPASKSTTRNRPPHLPDDSRR